MKGLTPRQRQILDYITESILTRGYPPTIREIGDEMGIKSTNGVNDHLKALERKGHLTRDDLKSRAMRPVHMDLTPPGMISVPLLGRVNAGQPVLAFEDAHLAEDSVKIDRLMVGNHDEVFALRIVGESMIEDGIFNGDYVFVRKTAAARRNDIVIAMIEGEATCKRYFPEGDQVRFQPANSAMEPIIVKKSEFRETMILGQVVGIYRRL